MNLPQAIEIVKDHIRIGKGMELVNGVPEALEMVVEELERYKIAFDIACSHIATYPHVKNKILIQAKGKLLQAKEGEHAED